MAIGRAARIAEVHQHHVRRKCFQPRHETDAFGEDCDIVETSLEKPLFDDSGPRSVFVDDRDLQPDLLLRCSITMPS